MSTAKSNGVSCSIRLHQSIPSWDSQALCDYLDIRPEERVLEIGSGHRPFLRANVVVDLDFTCGEHRDGQAMYIESHKTYIQADLTSLPFKDKSFDWVICSHVLEHVSNPAKACQELMRVAHKGFIETPRKWTEYYAGHPTHRWLIDEINEVLMFEPITWFESPFLNFALPPVWSSPLLLQRAEMEFHNIPCVQLIWHDSFEYYVKQTFNEELWTPQNIAIRHYYFAKNLLYWMTEPKIGLFHARRAYEIDSKNKKFRTLYACYLLLLGNLKDAHSLLLPSLSIISLVSSIVFLKLVHTSTRFFRKLLSFLWP